MYGPGDDHHVLFEPNEKKEFEVVFSPVSADFSSFDIQYFMKPKDDDYGRYMLRYSFQENRVIKRYCVQKYPDKAFAQKSWWQFWK